MDNSTAKYGEKIFKFSQKQKRSNVEDGCELHNRKSNVSAAALHAESFSSYYHSTLAIQKTTSSPYKNQTPTSHFVLAGPPRDPASLRDNTPAGVWFYSYFKPSYARTGRKTKHPPKGGVGDFLRKPHICLHKWRSQGVSVAPKERWRKLSTPHPLFNTQCAILHLRRQFVRLNT